MDDYVPLTQDMPNYLVVCFFHVIECYVTSSHDSQEHNFFSVCQLQLNIEWHCCEDHCPDKT